MEEKKSDFGRKLLRVAASLALALALSPLQAEAQQAKVKVGIIHIGSITDGGYNQAHSEGIAAMKKNIPGVEVIQVENVPESADAERVMENMIKQGAKIVFAASFGFLDPAIRVAKKYPEVTFFHPAGFKRVPNLTTYWASTPEAFYLMGIAAGKTTKTNKMGFVCALPVSYFLANVNALHLGAKSVNPKMETRLVFTGTFLDPGKEATAANALLDQGADVLGMIVDSPITVVQTAEKRGAHSVGYHYLGVQKFAPKGWISGVAFTWGGLYTRLVQQVLDGKFKSENILGSLATDMITLAPFGQAVPADAVKMVEETKKAFIDGKKQVFAGPIKDNKGAERVKAGAHWSMDDLGKMDWLVEGVVGQPK